MRRLTIVALLVGSGPAWASDPRTFMDALFSQMANTYLCRDALGGLAHYQAAKTIARESLISLVGEHDAIFMVAQMDKKFRSDPRSRHPHLDRQACIEQVNDGYEKIDVERERLKE